MLLDLVKFYTEKYGKLPYDPFTTHPIPLADILACAKAQGTTFRPADILILRVGFMQRYNGATQEERDGLAGKEETLCVSLVVLIVTFGANPGSAHVSAGIEQTEDMKRFLWDNHFAAVASDQPALEVRT